MLLVQKGQWLSVHLSCKIHGRMWKMQFFPLAKELWMWKNQTHIVLTQENKWRKMSFHRQMISGALLLDQNFEWNTPNMDGTPLVYLNWIQYFISVGVNGLSRGNDFCVLTIHQSSYNKRPALLSDMKYWFREIDLNNSHMKRAQRDSQSSR